MKGWKNKFHGKIFISVTKNVERNNFSSQSFQIFFPRTKYISSDKIISSGKIISQIFFGQRNIFLRFEIFFVRRKIFLRFENLFLVFKSSSTRFWGHESCPQNRVESYYFHHILEYS